MFDKNLDFEELLNNNDNIYIIDYTNIVLEFAIHHDIENFTNLKLQKLLYYTYATYMWIYKRILFDIELIEFWKLEPVIRDIPYVQAFWKRKYI